jgi:hypothetical protein
MLDATPYRIPSPPPGDLEHDGSAERRASLRMLGWSVGLFFVSLLAGLAGRAIPILLVGVFVSMILAVVGAARALVGIARVARSAGTGKGKPILKLVASFAGNAAFLAFGLLSAFVTTMSVHRGRQLRSRGRVLLPKVVRGAAWAQLPTSVGGPPVVDDEVRQALAAQWRENGRTEHASVAAFAQLTMDLMALGAPPELVAAAQKDALDEIRHAELCFSLARALDGRAQGPGPFPEVRQARGVSSLRSVALAGLAVDSLIDGGLHEGVSARILATLARRCELPAVQALLKELAADEGRHAAHGWDVVEWCLAEGGAPVARALSGAVQALPRQMRSPLPEPARDGGWQRYGIHGHRLESEAYARARADLVLRVHRLIATNERAAA